MASYFSADGGKVTISDCSRSIWRSTALAEFGALLCVQTLSVLRGSLQSTRVLARPIYFPKTGGNYPSRAAR